MLLILMVHANFKALNPPTFVDLQAMPINTFFRFLSESVSIIAVNVFVLISGWFGIRFKIVRLSELIFQILFFGLLVYVIMLVASSIVHTNVRKELFNIFIMKDFWFAKEYLVLYIFSPVLNAFVEKADRKQFSLFLISFYFVQTLHGFITESSWFFYGNSPLSFIGLYLLARYIRLPPPKLLQDE